MDQSSRRDGPGGGPTRRAGDGNRTAAYVLAAVSALISASFVALTPTTVSWEVDRSGATGGPAGEPFPSPSAGPAGSVSGHLLVGYGFKVNTVSLLFVAIQAVALASAVAAIVIGLRGNDRTARRLLAITALAGLIPAVLPGLLGGLAWYLLGRAPARPVT